MFVICHECGERHNSTEVKVINVEEDMEGRDVLTFICPVTDTETSSLVYRR